MKVNTLKLKALRMEHGLSQEDLARLIGTHTNTYLRKEKGEAEFTLSEIIKMHQLYKRPIVEIFFGNEVTDCITKQ